VARFAGTFWRLVQYARAFLPLAVSGVWEGLFKALADDPDNEYAMIATTIVRAHQHSAGALKWGLDHAIGRSRGGLTTKIHVILDALCNPLRLILTGGQVHDITQAEALLALIEPKALLADKGYDADQFADSVTARAMRLHEQAIRSARASRVMHNEALAYELDASYYAAVVSKSLRICCGMRTCIPQGGGKEGEKAGDPNRCKMMRAPRAKASQRPCAM
jgi:transposase